MPNILEAATEETLKQIRDRKPSSFTVGGQIKDGRLVGGVSYDRTWKNGWGLTAFAHAYWLDLPVSVGRAKPTVAAGFEAVKKF